MCAHDVTSAILVFQNNETAATLVYQDNPVGIELFSFVKTLLFVLISIDAGHVSEYALFTSLRLQPLLMVSRRWPPITRFLLSMVCSQKEPNIYFLTYQSYEYRVVYSQCQMTSVI